MAVMTQTPASKFFIFFGFHRAVLWLVKVNNTCHSMCYRGGKISHKYYVALAPPGE
jgi:hypothetical protein